MPPHAPRKTPRRSAGTPAERIVSVSGSTIARAEALHGARDVEREDRRRERGSRGGRGEDADADREHQPPPEAVAEGRTGEQEDGEDERVRVDGPFEPAEAGVQVLADHGDRRGHDEVVERDHEERGRRDRERPPGHAIAL